MSASANEDVVVWGGDGRVRASLHYYNDESDVDQLMHALSEVLAIITGWLLVLAAGLCQGSFMVPMKFTSGWKWENFWLVFAFTAYLICPWLFVSLTTSGAGQVYADAGGVAHRAVMLMGLLWGFGALTFGLGVDAVGLSIGFTVILGFAATSGTLVPLLLLNQSVPRSEVLLLTLVSLAVMLAGVAISSLAGRYRESATGSQVTREE